MASRGVKNYRFAMSTRRRSLTRTQARELFHRFDRDKNANIDQTEFVELLTALGAPLSSDELEVAWGEVDNDQNGRISFDEFFTWWSGEA